MEAGGPLDQFLMVLITIFSNPWVTGGTTAAVAAATQGLFVDAGIALVVGAVALFVARRTVGSTQTFTSLLSED